MIVNISSLDGGNKSVVESEIHQSVKMNIRHYE